MSTDAPSGPPPDDQGDTTTVSPAHLRPTEPLATAPAGADAPGPPAVTLDARSLVVAAVSARATAVEPAVAPPVNPAPAAPQPPAPPPDDTPTDRVPLADGLVVLNHRIVRALGNGGFGAVYEAVDLALERPVAFKVLHDPDGQVLARFRDEARLLARLNDPHIIQVYRIDRMPGGAPCLTMELFGDGHLGRQYPKGHPVAPAVALALMDQVLAALQAAHTAGIVHRDIKEANILVAADTGRVKVCDFGIARAVEPMTGEADPTGEGILGTPHYLAPERFGGVNDDPRSDLYAVGVVLYRLLTGRRPFETPGATPLAIAHRIVAEDPAPPEGVPGAVARLCLRLLARDRALRYATAAEARADLAAALNATDTAALPSGPDLGALGWAPGSGAGRRSAWLALALVVGLVGLAAALWGRGPRPGDTPAAQAPAARAPGPQAGPVPVAAGLDAGGAEAVLAMDAVVAADGAVAGDGGVAADGGVTGGAVDSGTGDLGAGARDAGQPAKAAVQARPRAARRPPGRAAKGPPPATRTPHTLGSALDRRPSRKPRSARALQNPIVTPEGP